jgi:hypothetical protein
MIIEYLKANVVDSLNSLGEKIILIVIRSRTIYIFICDRHSHELMTGYYKNNNVLVINQAQ